MEENIEKLLDERKKAEFEKGRKERSLEKNLEGMEEDFARSMYEASSLTNTELYARNHKAEVEKYKKEAEAEIKEEENKIEETNNKITKELTTYKDKLNEEIEKFDKESKEQLEKAKEVINKENAKKINYFSGKSAIIPDEQAIADAQKAYDELAKSLEDKKNKLYKNKDIIKNIEEFINAGKVKDLKSVDEIKDLISLEKKDKSKEDKVEEKSEKDKEKSEKNPEKNEEPKNEKEDEIKLDDIMLDDPEDDKENKSEENETKSENDTSRGGSENPVTDGNVNPTIEPNHVNTNTDNSNIKPNPINTNTDNGKIKSNHAEKYKASSIVVDISKGEIAVTVNGKTNVANLESKADKYKNFRRIKRVVLNKHKYEMPKYADPYIVLGIDEALSSYPKEVRKQVREQYIESLRTNNDNKEHDVCGIAYMKSGDKSYFMNGKSFEKALMPYMRNIRKNDLYAAIVDDNIDTRTKFEKIKDMFAKVFNNKVKALTGKTTDRHMYKKENEVEEKNSHERYTEEMRNYNKEQEENEKNNQEYEEVIVNEISEALNKEDNEGKEDR